MNLQQLKDAVDITILAAIEDGYELEEITVSIQVDLDNGSMEKFMSSAFSNDVKLHYDGDGCVSGCVIIGSGTID